MPAAPAAKSNVIPITSRLATAERLDDIPISIGSVVEPMPSPDPFASPAAAAPMPTSGLGSALAVPEAPAQKKPPPWILIAMLVLAGAFGVTLAVVIAVRPAQPQGPAPAPSVVIIQQAAPQQAPVAAVTVEPSAKPTTTNTTKVAAAKPTNTTPTASAKPIDLGGGLMNPVGPLTGGPAGPGQSDIGPCLNQQDIEGVVRSRQVGVRRACIEKGPPLTQTVQVRAKISVGGNGVVKSVSASGNDPIIAACIEKNIRTWSFRACGGTTPVEVPFSFVAQ